MDVLEAIEGRISAGKLGDPAPNREQIERMLQAAIRAPDHGRLAPWRFAVMTGDARRVLGDAMAASLRARDPAVEDAVVASERDKPMRAPTIVAVAAHTTHPHKVPETEQVLAVAAAVQNLLLAARALGFGAMWKTGAAAYDASVKRALGFDASDQIVAFVYLGTTLAPGKTRTVSLDGAVRHL